MVYDIIPVVPHKAVAEVSRIGNLWERLVVVSHGTRMDRTVQLSNLQTDQLTNSLNDKLTN